MANYSLGIKPLPTVENGHVFTGDNFLQLQPHTKIFEGVTGLKFINCNLTNCDIPADAICEGCSPRHAEWCSHLHEHFVDHGLVACAANCSHVTSVDTVTIDGVVVDTTYTYADKAVS
jgi:hypothetical protein